MSVNDWAGIDWCDTLNNSTILENDRLKKFDIVVCGQREALPR